MSGHSILLELKGEIDSNTITVGTSTFHLHQWRDFLDKNVNIETSELNYTTHQMDLTDIYRMCHPMTAKYTFFSPEHEIIFRIIIYWSTK
jgi:exonuclease III